jgi:hypothetical protein
MRRFRGVIVALVAGVGAAGLGGLAAFGCSSSSTKAEPGPDSGQDVTTDTRPDVVVNEAGDAGEAAADAQDAADVGSDADAEPPGLIFAQNEATALCTAYANCCKVQDPGVSFYIPQCVANLLTSGWEGSLPALTSVYSRGHVTVDQTKAAACIAAINNFQCPTQTAAGWSTITQACALVLTGTIPANQPGCVQSFECATNTYCDPTVDGGLCRPLATQGQPCNTAINSTIAPVPDQMCSYLASGQPALFCDLIDNGPDAATCQPVLANGATCTNAVTGYYDDQACPAAAALCGDDNKCGDTASYPNIAGSCAAFPVPADAGGGG